MRIISQDGTIDIPYGLTSIQLVSKTTIVAQGSYFGSGNDNFATIAEYSTEAKAQKAMEMLREQYMNLGMIKILASGTCEYMDKSLEKEEKMEIYTDYCRKHCFRFPQDEDVEV